MAEILWDGSSHTQGHSDERRLGGYQGRTRYAHEQYGKEHVFPYTKAGKPAGKVTSHHDRSAAGKTLFEINATLGQHVDLIRNGMNRNGHIFAVLEIGLYWQNREYEINDESLGWWELQLDQLHQICKDKDITPIIMGSPVPLPDTLWLNGQPANDDLLGRLAVLTAEHTSVWAETHISPEAVLGADKVTCMAEDGIHLRSDGYLKMARFIIPQLNNILEIPHHQVPLPGS